MTKMSAFLVALFFTGVSVAYAAVSGQTTATNSIDKVEAANHSNGKADKGLDTAEKNIAKHDQDAKHDKDAKTEGKAEKAEHAARPERPVKPERVAR